MNGSDSNLADVVILAGGTGRVGGATLERLVAGLEPAEFAAAAAPEEVADVLAFHVSDRSTKINGELIRLNARETD